MKKKIKLENGSKSSTFVISVFEQDNNNGRIYF